MKRFLFFALVTCIVAFFGSHFYYTKTMEKHLNTLVRQMQPLGTLEYRSTGLSPFGDAYINGVRFKPQGSNDALWVDSVVLRAGNLWRLHQLPGNLKQGRYPDKMGLSVQGLRVATNNSFLRNLQVSSRNDSPQLSAAGCQNRRAFSGQDMTDMGYWEVITDINLYYTITNSGNLKLTASSHLHGMASTDLTMNLQLPSGYKNTPSRIAEEARLTSTEFRYRDLGYTPRIISFCSLKTQLNPDAYLEQHLAAWADVWKARGLVAGPNIMNAYGRFITQPDRFELQLLPSASVSLTQFADLPPEALDGQIIINDDMVGNLDFTAMSAEDAAAFRETIEQANRDNSQQTGTPSAPVPRGDGMRSVRVAELSQHEGAVGTVQLTDGRLYRGRITGVTASHLQFERREGSGFITTPIAFEAIQEVRLRL